MSGKALEGYLKEEICVRNSVVLKRKNATKGVKTNKGQLCLQSDYCRIIMMSHYFLGMARQCRKEKYSK